MADKEKTTARISSATHKESLSSRGALAKGFHYVGAEQGQSFLTKDKNSIADADVRRNSFLPEAGANAPVSDRRIDPDKSLTVMDQLHAYVMSKHLNTVTMSELYDRIFQNRPPVIEGLLYPGTYLFAGAPKLGKSFLMMEMAYHVATGTSLWEYPARKGTVLYLALEDDQRRLQERLYRMFGTECTEHLHLATRADSLGGTLMDQLRNFVKDHPDTALIIIDTLQKIREIGGESYSYSNDYEVITRLKEFTDATGICLLLVHHTRKQQADDKFEMISGTNGLMGAADGAFLLHKDKRVSSEAVLEISGRDQPDQTLYLNRDEETLVWNLDKAEMETFKPKPDPVIEAVAGFITDENPAWHGTATELVEVLHLEISPNTLTMRLNINASRLLNEYGIQYANIRNHAGRQVSLIMEHGEA